MHTGISIYNTYVVLTVGVDAINTGIYFQFHFYPVLHSQKKIVWAIDNFFLAKVILNRYYKWKNISKNFGIYFLGTILGLRRAKFCCKVVI